jgi:aspartyl aminopeptidase
MHRPAITGLHNEFVSSPRLDNLCSSVCALDALITETKRAPADDEVSMILLFDHEEVGSCSA